MYVQCSTVLDTSPYSFKIQITTEEYDADIESNGLACRLLFTYTAKYPDTAPLVEIEDAIHFEDDYEDTLLKHINETVCSWCHIYILHCSDRYPQIL